MKKLPKTNFFFINIHIFIYRNVMEMSEDFLQGTVLLEF